MRLTSVSRHVTTSASQDRRALAEGIISRYTALVLNPIMSRWTVPAGTTQMLLSVKSV